MKLVEGNPHFFKTTAEIEKHWKNTKSKFDSDFDGALSRQEIALYLANTHVRAFYFVRRDQLYKEQQEKDQEQAKREVYRPDGKALDFVNQCLLREGCEMTFDELF